MLNKVERKKIVFYGPITNVHLTKWANSLCAQHDITILYDEKHSIQMQKLNPKIKTIYIPDYINFPAKTTTIKKTFYMIKLRNFIKNLDYDILHLHFMERKMIFLSDLKNCIVSIWGMDLVYDGDKKEKLTSKIFKKITMQNASRLIVSSDFMYEYTKIYSKTVQSKIEVIKLGVDLNYFKKHSEKNKNNKQKILFAKHFYEKYGPEYLLEAFEMLIKDGQNIELVMLGDGPLLESLKQKYIHLINDNYLVMPGKVTQDIVKNYMNESDIFVMPSVFDSETLGVAAIEALAMELIVIATKVGGVPEVVINGKTGYLVEKRDSKKLYDALLYTINHDFSTSLIAENGRVHAEKYFNWDNCVKKINTIYQEI